MPNFFPPPLPFFRPHPYYYNSIRNKQNTHTNIQNHENNNKYFSNMQSNNIPYHNQNKNQEQKQNINLNNNNDINQHINPNNYANKKNSITTKNRNTISSILPFDISHLIPNNLGPLNINIDGFTDSSEYIFELFGIKLYLDDIIIICILIFLYQEDVKDEMLYLILIMLLFS